mgnify:CR=1 FL=1
MAAASLLGGSDEVWQSAGSEGIVVGKWRVLELFAGLGGLACSWPEAEIAVALDINVNAQQLYRLNFHHDYRLRTLESMSPATLQRFGANFWWMSPPCQPFSRRGHGLGLADPRSAAFLNILQAIDAVRPEALGLENVHGFQGSEAHASLKAILHQHGYYTIEQELCPSQFGWPNLRPRFYLLACRQPLPDWQPTPQYGLRLIDQLDEMPSASPLWISAEVVRRFESAMDRVDALDARAISSCFGSSYGKSILHAGSYVRYGERYRRFSPREIARVLGFPEGFRLVPGEAPEDVTGPRGERASARPAGVSLNARPVWKLLGNSLSLPVVRYVLSHLPDGPATWLPWADNYSSPRSSSSR